MFYISLLKVKLTHDISDNMAIITLYWLYIAFESAFFIYIFV